MVINFLGNLIFLFQESEQKQLYKIVQEWEKLKQEDGSSFISKYEEMKLNLVRIIQYIGMQVSRC